MKIASGTFRLTLPGAMLARGFWLYVWSVTTPTNEKLLYVGRTGDNSSPNASPAYIRMGQHLGLVKNQNALRRHLSARGIEPEDCTQFDFMAHGPIYPEIEKPVGFRNSDPHARRALMDAHVPLRDVVGALEKRLATALRDAGYEVLNIVVWRHPVDAEHWLPVRAAFAEDFPGLMSVP